MEDKQSIRHIPVGIAAGLLAIALASGGGAAWLSWNSFQANTPPQVATPANPSQAQQPNSTAQAPQERTASVYWLRATGNRIELAPSSIPLDTAAQPREALQAAFNQLLAGPTNSEVNTTTIPEGTTLRNLEVRSEGVHVDLSQEFTQGGGSASMIGRVAQILYTATSLDPQARVWIAVEGERLEVLGGEGLLLDQPLTRKSFESNFDL